MWHAQQRASNAEIQKSRHLNLNDYEGHLCPCHIHLGSKYGMYAGPPPQLSNGVISNHSICRELALQQNNSRHSPT